MSGPAGAVAERVARKGSGVCGRSIRAGFIAAAALSLFYAVVVGLAGGIEHLARQAADDWPWLAMVVAGFGTQVALFAELRRRRRLNAELRTTTAGGGAASAVGMVACCAHHIADLVPVIGASGAAVFLTDYRVPVMAAGIAVNAAGVLIAAHRLRRTPLPAAVAWRGRYLPPATKPAVPACPRGPCRPARSRSR